MRPVRVGTIDRISDDRDQLRVRNGIANAQVRAVVPQVERRALAAQRSRRSRVEQLLVAVALPDPFLGAVRVAGTAMVFAARTAVRCQEVLGFLGSGEV